MPSNSLLDNRHFNKLAVNRLKAQAIRSDNIQPSSETISYLFSVLLENGTFERNNTGGTLTFDLNVENNEVIQFSDRPFRQTNNISINTFVTLFTLGGTNSFEIDPPNIVLAHSEEQRTYIMKLSTKSDNQVIFNLELLPDETHNLETVTGNMSLFVDSVQDLRSANFTGADLIGANFTGADLRSANLRNANLRNANVTDADLRGTIIIGANTTNITSRFAKFAFHQSIRTEEQLNAQNASNLSFNTGVF